MEVVSSETRPSIPAPPKLTCCAYPLPRAFMSFCTARECLRDGVQEAKDEWLWYSVDAEVTNATCLYTPLGLFGVLYEHNVGVQIEARKPDSGGNL